MAEDIEFLSFPGYDILNDHHYNEIENSLKKFKKRTTKKIGKFALVFGCNEASNVSNKTFFPHSPEFEKMKTKLLFGNTSQFVNESDPLNINNLLDPKFKDSLDHKFTLYFKRLESLIKLAEAQNTVIYAPGPRYMMDPEDSIMYNVTVSHLIHSMYMYTFPEGLNVNVCNHFVHDWCRGTINLLHVHSPHEANKVIRSKYLFFSNTFQSQHYHPPCRYGAVHYSHNKYMCMYSSMSPRVPDLCRLNNFMGHKVQPAIYDVHCNIEFPSL